MKNIIDTYIRDCNQDHKYLTDHEFKKLLTLFYNKGYMSGHHDTVEGQFIDIHYNDMEEYNTDVVEDILNDK